MLASLTSLLTCWCLCLLRMHSHVSSMSHGTLAEVNRWANPQPMLHTNSDCDPWVLIGKILCKMLFLGHVGSRFTAGFLCRVKRPKNKPNQHKHPHHFAVTCAHHKICRLSYLCDCLEIHIVFCPNTHTKVCSHLTLLATQNHLEGFQLLRNLRMHSFPQHHQDPHQWHNSGNKAQDCQQSGLSVKPILPRKRNLHLALMTWQSHWLNNTVSGLLFWCLSLT